MTIEARNQADIQVPKSDVWQGWKKQLCIAVPTTGLVRIEWVMARFGQVIPVNWANGDMFQWFDMYSPLGNAVAEARNLCVNHAVQQGFEWLLFIDQDVILPQDTFLKINEYMREAKYPVVCGLYYCKGSMPEPLLFRGRGTSWFTDWKRGEKVWVDGIPMGCTLIHMSLMKALYDASEPQVCRTLIGPQVARKIFETPRHAWFDPEEGKYNTKVGTEDLFWCDRIMKEGIFEKAGWKDFVGKENPFLCDTSIFCQHIDERGTMYPMNVGIR
jgi:hypothetical protein